MFTDGAIAARSVAENSVPDPNDADAGRARAAVAAYLQGVISKEEALAVIKLYFAS